MTPARGAGTAAAAKGQVWAVRLFLISLLVPFSITLGPLNLMPHRLVLIGLFLPLFAMLFVLGRAGPVLASDWLMLGAVFWSLLALVVNHGVAGAIEPAGINFVESLGAYMLARVGIRSGADFRNMVWTVFVMLAILLPFAAAESLLRRPVMLELIPGAAIQPVDAGLRMGLRRAQTVFAHPILFGVFVSTTLGLFWYALRPRWLRIPAVPMTVLGTFFSLSTGAVISIVVQSIFIGWELVLRSMRRRWLLFALLVVLAYAAIDLLSNRTPFHVLVTYGSFYQSSAYGRIVIWQYGTQNVWANPVFGLGLRDWVRPAWMPPSVDNFWLYTTMRFGLPFMAMMAASLLLLLRRVSQAAVTDPGDRLARAGYLVAFGGLVIAGGTVHYWHAMLAFVMFIFGSGVWVATGGALAPAAEAPAAAPAERLSRYTRQPAPGVPIGAPASTGVSAAPPERPRSPRDRASPAARPSRPSRRNL